MQEVDKLGMSVLECENNDHTRDEEADRLKSKIDAATQIWVKWR